jgi:hypothetical protein
MSKVEICCGLRAIAECLQPLTRSVAPGSAVWDGSRYVHQEVKSPDPYALAWWSILTTMADLIEHQECALSRNQLSHMKRLLFGGMGSLNDFSPSVPTQERLKYDQLNRELFEGVAQVLK